jgi:hypothetical protein
MADPPREINTARASSSMPKVNGTSVRRGRRTRHARRVRSPFQRLRGVSSNPQGSLLDNKNGGAAALIASRGGPDDPTQFVRAFQRLRIGFV